MTTQPDTLARLREELTAADAEGWYQWPTKAEVVALLDIAEAAQRLVATSEASLRYPASAAVQAHSSAEHDLRSALASLDAAGGEK